MSLLTSFNSGVAGIRSAQSGLNTTSHNISNAKTAGYTRQQNIQRDAYYQFYKYGKDRSMMQIGMGASISQIRQIRDIFLDKEYRLEIGRQTFYEKLATTASEVEDIFGELEGVQFQNSIGSLWEVLQDLSIDPGEITNRELFITKAESFLESAKNIYNSLRNYQISLNTEIKDQVDKINSIGEQIARLNVLVARSEAAGLENANDYRDARNLLMDELGKYTNYTYNEDINGRVQIYIDNAIFVSEGRSFHMGCETMPPYGMYNVIWLDNGYDQVYDISEAYSSQKKTDVGSLRGILTARGSDVGDYLDIPVEPKQEDYVDVNGNPDETAYKVAMNKFKEDLRVYNNTTANSVITRIQAQFDRLVYGIIKTINDAFAPNIEANLTGVSGTLADGSAINLADGTYHILDVNNCPYGTDDAETIGTEVFRRSQIDRYQVITLTAQIYLTDENGNPVLDEDGNQIGLARENEDGTFSLYVYNEEKEDDIDWRYTLLSLEINEDLTADYSLLPLKANPKLGMSEGYDFTREFFGNLLDKWSQKFAVLDPNTLASYNFNEYYAYMIGDLSTQGHTWNNMVDHQTSLAESIEDKRQQVAGVSTEEEMVSLLMYQHAYNAASRYITTIDAMLEHLIERLG